jgi:hypothetical protein
LRVGCGKVRRSRWWPRIRRRRPELPRRGALSVGGNGERWRGRCCCSGERERERGSRRARMEEEGEASVARRSWWPTRACPPRRMGTTWRQGSTGSPRRQGAAGRYAWTRERAWGGGRRARGLGRLRPAGQKRGHGLLAPPFLFLNFFFPSIFHAHFHTFKIFFKFGP